MIVLYPAYLVNKYFINNFRPLIKFVVLNGFNVTISRAPNLRPAIEEKASTDECKNSGSYKDNFWVLPQVVRFSLCLLGSKSVSCRDWTSDYHFLWRATSERDTRGFNYLNESMFSRAITAKSWGSMGEKWTELQWLPKFQFFQQTQNRKVSWNIAIHEFIFLTALMQQNPIIVYLRDKALHDWGWSIISKQ